MVLRYDCDKFVIHIPRKCHGLTTLTARGNLEKFEGLVLNVANRFLDVIKGAICDEGLPSIWARCVPLNS
jgi:hypothetical protein